MSAQNTFEALMRAQGKQNFEKTARGRYKDTSMQVRWHWFLTGWELRNATKTNNT